MNFTDQLIAKHMNAATPAKLRSMLPGILSKGTQEQFQAVMDCVLTELKRRERQNATATKPPAPVIR